MPECSVIVPIYNREKLLRRCMTALLAEKDCDLEIILVDDGSTDGSPALCDEYARQDPRVQVIHQPNGGVSAARNAALSRVSSPWVRFVDSDDQVIAGSTRRLLDAVEKSGASMAVGPYIHVQGPLQEKVTLGVRPGVIPVPELLKIFHKQSNAIYWGALWNKVFETRILREDGLSFEVGLNYGEDFMFLTRYLSLCSDVAVVGEPVYRYIREPNSLTFRQAFDCIPHPLKNIKIKQRLYGGLCSLYESHDLREKYRKDLWHYLFRFGTR